MFRHALLLGSTFIQSFTIIAQPATAFSIPTISHTASPLLFGRDLNPQANSFQKPPPSGPTNDFSNNTIYPINSTLSIMWVSEWPSVDIALCQPTTGTTVGCEVLLQNIKGKGYLWSVSNDTGKMYGQQGDFWSPDIYFFQLTPTNTQNPYIRSHYFNITKGPDSGDGSASNTSATPSASSTATGSSLTPDSTATSAHPISSPTGAPAATGFDALSIGAKIGIYVGAAAVVAGITAAAMFWFITRQRKRKRAENLAKVGITESTSTLTSPVPLQELDSESSVHETGAALPHEISSKEIPIEMPAEIPGLAVSTYDDDDGGWDWRHSSQQHARPRGIDQ